MEEEDEKDSQNKEGIITESDLLDVYDFQYNDLFSKILKINEEKFFALLQEQVILNLRVINKLSDLSLMSYFQEFILERYKTEKKKITNDIEKLKKIPEEEKVYLDYSNCYIHCHRNIKVFHKCLNRLILYEGFIYCLNCKKVYNENQIKLYCIDCEEVYFSKIRKNYEKNNEFFFPVVFAKNHCQSEYDEEEKIKCLECGEDLYYDLSKEKDEKYKYKKQSELIKEIICTKCKLIFDTREIRFTCSECESDFMSDAKLYNEFPIYKRKILYLIHTLRKDKLALPENFNGKKCKCDINLIKEFLHEEDNGILLQGSKDEKNKIMCEQCFEIFDGDKFEWKCPSCGDKFKVIKPIESNVIKTRSRSRSNKYIKAEIRNDFKEDKKDINIKEDNKMEIKDIKEDKKEKENKIEIKNEVKNEIKNNYKIEIKKDVKNEENEIKNNFNKKDDKYEQHSERIHHSSLDKNKNNKNENIIDEKKNDNIINIKNEDNKSKNKNSINISNYNSNNNKYNKRSDKINININNNNNNYRNYNQRSNQNNNNNKYNYNDKKNNYRKLKTQIKEENKNNRDKDVKEVYKNVSTKVIIDTKSNYNNNNSISNKRNADNQKKENYVNIRNKNKNSIYNIRQNHQIININETSRRANQNRNSALIENSKKDVVHKEKKEKEKEKEKAKENKKNIEEFNNIKRYFEDFNEEYEKDMERKNKKIQLKKEKKEKECNSNNNLHIQINVDNKNHIKNNISNVHNVNNIYNINHISNRAVNDAKNRNYQYTDNNNVINQKYKRQPNGSRENIKDKKDIKKNLSTNKFTSQNTQNTSRRRKPNNVNIKINNYNKENNDNNNCQKQNIQINNDKNKNEQKVISKQYDTHRNKKEEEQNKNENKPDIENKNDINIIQEPEIKIEQTTYTQITINSNNFKNIRILGQGSYGKIYLVEDTKTHEQFAMKKLILGDKLELRDNQDEYNMIMQITSSYPELNIIQVFGTETKNFDEYNFVFYVLMEVANCDWEKELLNRSRHKAFYTEDEIFYILENLVDTFAYLQQIGICHRDIKPQNILCFGEKGYKISDFGEAKYRKKWRLQQSSVNYTSMQTVRGTELYMSPILYTALKSCPNKGANHNVFKSDVFSLGMCFLFASCLDYKSLYEIRKVNSMNKLQELVEQYIDGKYSQSFTDILLSMLKLNEKERPDFIELSAMI